jgi:signal transduction histidine kinase
VARLSRFDPDDPIQSRRAHLLVPLLLGTMAGAALVSIELFVRSILAGRFVDGSLLPILLAILTGTGLLLVFGRRITTELQGGLFVALMLCVLLVADEPEQLVSGRSTWYLALPVLISGVVVRPLAALIMAGLAAAGLAFVSLHAQTPPSTIQVSGLGLLGLLGWLVSGNLDRALARLAEVNRTLDRKVAERTRALEGALARLESTQAGRMQAQKLAAVGQLAAGIAHEVNNPLAVILGFAQGLEQRVPEGDALRLPVVSIAREVRRCKALVEGLLAFARVGRPAFAEVELGEALRAAALLIEARARLQAVGVEVQVSAERLVLEANRTQLVQVLVNLGTNALDAMPDGGELTLRACPAGPDEVHLEVADTGPGIPAEIQERIFEPFFTTREARLGTGLGLSLSYEIVRQHQGVIQVESWPGQGSVFAIRLPRRQAPGGMP